MHLLCFAELIALVTPKSHAEGTLPHSLKFHHCLVGGSDLVFDLSPSPNPEGR